MPAAMREASLPARATSAEYTDAVSPYAESCDEDYGLTLTLALALALAPTLTPTCTPSPATRTTG